MKNSLKSNLSYQTIYQFLNICLPLITAPYLSRVLGPAGLGVYSFVTSISDFFILFAMLGINNYGTRCVAECKHDKSELTFVFKEIYCIQLITSIACIILYGVYIVFLCEYNSLIATIQGIAVLSCLLNINWFFFGLEEFKLTVMRNMFIRIVTFFLIILLVNKETDLWLYTLLMASSTLVSNFVLWFFLPYFITIRKNRKLELKKHIKPIILLFIPLMAMSIYHLMDKVMLGWLSTYKETGYYYNVDKIINIPAGILLGIGTVMLPRITSLITEGKKNESVGLFLKTLEGLIVTSVAISFGTAAISDEFIPFFFGEGYNNCILLTIVLCPVLIIKAFSLTIRNVYLVPNHKDKYYIQSVVAGAVVNIIINYLLIPKFDALGAVIGTLFAELVACIWQYYAVRKELKYVSTIVRSFSYFIIGCVMYVVVRLTANMLTNFSLFVRLLIEIVIGGAVFSIICLLFWQKTKNDFLALFINNK